VTGSGPEDEQLGGTLSCTDVEGSPLTYALAGAASHGTAAVGANGTWTYDPAPDFNGADAFTYTAYAGTDSSNAGTVDLTITAVNDAPVAGDDTITVAEDAATDVTAMILANDTDVDSGDTLSVTGTSGASGGTAVLDGGTVTFTPDADACGTGEGGFSYSISDGHGGTASADVTVNVTCVNDAPVATDDTITITEDTPTDVTDDILANDTDVDGDLLFVAGPTDASGGTLAYSTGTHHVTFTPSADLCGSGVAGFDYLAADGTLTDAAHVTIDATCVNDNPVAASHTATGTEDTDVVVSGATLLDGATDVDGGDVLSVTGTSDPADGAVAWDGSVATFTPAANACGTDAGGFDYVISDGHGGTATGHVSVDLTCVEDPPVAVDDTGTAAEGSGPALYDVLANDTDPDPGASLTIDSVDVDGAPGTASIVDGRIQFTPAAGFTGDATIRYVVSDGTLTDDGTLTVSVIVDATPPVVTAPTVAFGTGRVRSSAPLRITWTASDAGSGIATIEVQVSVGGGAWTSVYTGTATTVTRGYPFGKSLVWRVRATDRASNTSAWATSATRSLIAYQAPGSSSIAYSGRWVTTSSASASGGAYRYVTTRFSTAALTFVGRSVLYVAPKTASSGYVKVYVDGHLVGRYSERRATSLVGQIIASKSWTSSGRHSIKIVNDSSGRRANLDAFIVLK
jgi:hypothetical protein